MSVDAGMAGWRPEEWARWAGCAAAQRPVLTEASSSSFRRRISRGRLVAGIAGFACLAAVLWLVPYRIAGELADSRLQPIEPPLCDSCPASQLITAAGVRSVGGRQWLTVRFATPPQAATFDLVFHNPEIVVNVSQRADGRWVMAAPRSAGVELVSFALGLRHERLVVELPSIANSGIALGSAGGSRFPAQGVLVVQNQPAREWNVVDILAIALVLAGAWRGYRTGTFVMAIQLVTLTVLVLAVRFAAVAVSSALGAFALGAVIAILGIALPLVARRFVGPTRETRERGLGSVLGMVRAVGVAAMLLAIASDQALFEAVTATVERSTTGGALVDAWRAILTS
jgi:hypothetical protein